MVVVTLSTTNAYSSHSMILKRSRTCIISVNMLQCDYMGTVNFYNIIVNCRQHSDRELCSSHTFTDTNQLTLEGLERFS